MKTVNLDEEIHKNLKILSAETGFTIKELLAKALPMLEKQLKGNEK